jgi:hypothetical protein
MKIPLIVIVHFLSFIGFSQSLKIDKIIYDFGVLKSWEGIVTTDFLVTNESQKTFTYKNVISSCGCAIIDVSKDTILPNESVWISAIMDPSKDSGMVKKSLSIHFEDLEMKKTSFHINLVANVLNESEFEKYQKEQIQKEQKIKYFYQQKSNIEKFDENSEDFKSFIAKAKSEVLFNQHVKVLITLYAESDNYSFEKTLKSIRKSILKNLKKEGINEEKVIFANPMAEWSSDRNYIQLSILENKREENEFVRFETSNTKEIIQYNKLKFPVYFQFFKGGINDIDTTETTFNEYIEEMTSLLENTDEKVHLVFYSSASKAPNNSGYTPYQMAKLRGERTKKTFLRQASKHQLDTSKIKISVIPIVSGPEFSTRHYLVDYYYNFQYIKIVAVDVNYVRDDNKFATVYLQFFNSGKTFTDPNSQPFKDLVNKIIDQYETKGFAVLILESSSSNVPTYEFRSCDVLAYNRISDFKKALTRAIYQEGLDVRKLIFSEERTLVQGPAYNSELPKSVYEPYQYIKAFLEE